MKFFKFIMTINIILSIIAYFGICVYAESTTYVWSSNSNSIKNETTSSNDADTEEAETTAEPENNSNPLGLESASAILIEQNSGQVLYEHNSHEQLRPASVTKVMSILLIMEQIDTRKA